MLETLRGELIYIWYYFDIQLRQIFMYWVLGMVIGSLVSVFAKDKIHQLFASMQGTGIGTVGIFLTSTLGILSPLCIASSKGKSHIHSGGTSTNGFDGEQDAFLESMAEAGKAVSDSLGNGKNIVYVNVK